MNELRRRMTPTPTLETPRLLLRPLDLADAAQVQLLFPHWEIVRHLAAQVPWPYPPTAPTATSAIWRCPPSSAAKRGNGLSA